MKKSAIKFCEKSEVQKVVSGGHYTVCKLYFCELGCFMLGTDSIWFTFGIYEV